MAASPAGTRRQRRGRRRGTVACRHRHAQLFIRAARALRVRAQCGAAVRGRGNGALSRASVRVGANRSAPRLSQLRPRAGGIARRPLERPSAAGAAAPLATGAARRSQPSHHRPPRTRRAHPAFPAWRRHARYPACGAGLSAYVGHRVIRITAIASGTSPTRVAGGRLRTARGVRRLVVRADELSASAVERNLIALLLTREYLLNRAAVIIEGAESTPSHLGSFLDQLAGPENLLGSSPSGQRAGRRSPRKNKTHARA